MKVYVIQTQTTKECGGNWLVVLVAQISYGSLVREGEKIVTLSWNSMGLRHIVRQTQLRRYIP